MNLNLMKKYVKIKIFVEFNLSMKSDKMAYVIYVDIESLIKKDRCICKQSRNFFNNQNR